VQCLQAIFKTFQNNKQPTYFEASTTSTRCPAGAHGRRDRPSAHPIRLAANNPYMGGLPGAVRRRIRAPGLHPAKYIQEVLRPNIEVGARKSGRPMSNIDILGAAIIVTAKNQAELKKERHLLKRRVAFYASTRTYHPMFEIHGWNELGLKLHASRWRTVDEMVKLIPDEMAEAFGIIGSVDEIGAQLHERYGNVLTTISFPTDFPCTTPEDQKQARRSSSCLHGSTA